MSKRSNNSSGFPFADAVREEICANWELDADFAPNLPTPEKIIVAINEFAAHEFQRIWHAYTIAAYAKKIDPADFEKEQRTFLDFSGKILGELFEEVAFIIAFRQDDASRQEEIYRNTLMEMMTNIYGDETERARATEGFQFPLIQEIEKSLDEYFYKQARANLRVIKGGRNGNGPKKEP